MAKIHVHAFQADHLDRFVARDKSVSLEAQKAKIRSLYALGGSEIRTILLGDEVVGVVGVTPYWRGMGEVWTMLSDRIREAPVGFHRAISQLIEELMTSGAYHRIHSFVRWDFDAGLRWIQSLGFWYEGRLSKFGEDRSDHFLFARVA
jgi:hypothetical protein